MKLKNKKTGKIVTAETYRCGSNCSIELVFAEEDQPPCEYNSLAELCEEWEDYEEPNIYWYITSLGEVVHRGFSLKKWGKYDDDRKQMGNYFSTKEEAERAVEKLKAWKRLQDKDFKICGWNMAMRELDVKVPEKFFDKQGPITMRISDETRKDLDLLFTGDEE